MARMKFSEAIDRAVAAAMARDERIIIMGEDVPMTRSSLLARFGPNRVLKAPISEAAFTAAGVGAAMAGLRPIVEIWMVDFIGCAMAAETMRQLQGASHPNTVFAGATVQEEVGLRGAQTSAFKVQPDVAFALDVGIAHDTPGTEGDEKLGGGPLVVVYDATSIPNRGLLDLVMDTAQKLRIPLQFESVERGGTDAGKFHVTGQGVPSISMGVPARYIHSHVSIIDRRDFDRTVKLLVGVVKRLDKKTVARL